MSILWKMNRFLPHVHFCKRNIKLIQGGALLTFTNKFLVISVSPLRFIVSESSAVVTYNRAGQLSLNRVKQELLNVVSLRLMMKPVRQIYITLR